MNKRLYTPDDVATAVGLGAKAVRRKLREMGIRVGKGGRHTFTKAEFDGVVRKIKATARKTRGRRSTATVPVVEYADAGADVRAVYDDIMRTRAIDFVPNFWKTLAHHPPTLERVWAGIKEVMAPGALDQRTKEMIAVAVSATNGCEYCIRSHTAAARKLGMDDAAFGELMAVVGMFNQTNKLVFGYQVEVDEAFKAE